MLAPQQIDDSFLLLVDRSNDRLCELCPSEFLVRIGLMRLDRQSRIEQQHALLPPFEQMAMLRLGEMSRTQIGHQFLVDVLKRRGNLHTLGHTETQTCSSSRGGNSNQQ